jgi:anti-sigma factor RsiW
MRCGELVQFLLDYLEGELPPDVAASFRDHLDKCPPCLVYLRTYQQTILTARRALCDDKPCSMPKVPEEMIRAILDARASDPGTRAAERS